MNWVVFVCFLFLIFAISFLYEATFSQQTFGCFVSKDWANRQLAMLASLWPLSFEALCPYWVPGLKGLGMPSEAGPESQFALGSVWTALGEWGTDGGTQPAPPIVGRQVACDMVLS